MRFYPSSSLSFSSRAGLVLCGLLLPVLLFTQDEETVRQGHPIGTVTTRGDLIVLELNDGALGKANLFDLVGHTLHFSPEGPRYRVENGALQWDPDFGSELKGADVALHQFAFPFSGQRWDSFHVGTTGSIRFGEPAQQSNPFANGRSDGGVSIGRFDPLAEAAGALIES